MPPIPAYRPESNCGINSSILGSNLSFFKLSKRRWCVYLRQSAVGRPGEPRGRTRAHPGDPPKKVFSTTILGRARPGDPGDPAPGRTRAHPKAGRTPKTGRPGRPYARAHPGAPGRTPKPMNDPGDPAPGRTRAHPKDRATRATLRPGAPGRTRAHPKAYK